MRPAALDGAALAQCRRWLALAAAALAGSALAAIVLVLARTPLLSSAGVAAHFSAALILHVELATLVWFLAFSMALSTALVRADGGLVDRLALILAGGGFGAVLLSPVFSPAPPLLTNYFPVSDSLWFVLGLLVFVAAVLLALARLLIAGRQRWCDGIFRAWLWALLPLALAAAALAWSLREIVVDDPATAHEIVSWAPGHLIQFFFVAMMMLAWLGLANAFGWESSAKARIDAPFAAAALPSLLAIPICLAFSPATPEFRKAFTLLMAAATWVGPLWLLLRWRGRLLPSKQDDGPAGFALRASILLFVAGCVLGAVIRTDNTLVPAHYHGTVGAVTLAFMGVGLKLLEGGGQERLRRWVVRLYGMGFAVMVASLGWTGLHGAPRKTPYAVPSSEAFGYSAAMAAHGVGGLLAVSGTVLFAWVVLRALWRREAMRDLFALPTVQLLQTSPAGRRDVRRRAIVIAVSATVLVGATIAGWSQQAAWRAATIGLLAWMPSIDKLSHVTERRRMEVAARFEQGVTMLRAGEFEYAMTAFHRVLLLDPRMPEAHANLGFALIGLGEFAAARDFFQSALALRDTQTNAYFGLAEAYEGLGDIEMALGAMRTFSHLAAPDDRFRIRAESAIWEWESKLALDRGEPSASPGAAANTKKAKKGQP